MMRNLFFMLATLLIVATLITSCKKSTPKTDETTENVSIEEKAPFFKLSLAQWSLHRAIRNEKTLDPLDFAKKAKELGFEGIEYVSGLYSDNLKTMGMEALQDSLKAKSEAHGVKNVLIMVDGEGNLASTDEKERNEAIENHKKWVDAAAFLGCHAIRVNLSGAKEKEAWIESSVKGLGKLAEYGATKNINVIVENHGGFSSNAEMLSEVMTKINMDNCGTLPDFGNFCITKEDGECVDSYDNYKGTEILMKHAKAVSAKSYDFDAEGNETKLDYPRLLQIVKDAGYTGFIGVEYEGNRLSEEEGIQATKDLLINASKSLN
ncbi:sugar phosphate isomerase/epimerase family protein [Aureibaculum sp. 2210JD6-5]|uniref:sugar phosphate isomerase/epimerase family protein n=1 Tax=Aureibaculum sp. 2210JD6-5 TaxID=3103957 RepID=UPI002AAD2664|nr:sugar phosphate isomerase/epimerase family protein [Aureibaculum sp. 2210JD6-5]MDY7395755.1 sugar phosphate isomerase/epimerase family protein [Aureibaculum sp. 2210JD6-5]